LLRIYPTIVRENQNKRGKETLKEKREGEKKQQDIGPNETSLQKRFLNESSLGHPIPGDLL